MNRRDFLRLAGVSAAAIGTMGLAERLLLAQTGDKAKRPNIVFLFADQHRNCSWPGGGDAQVKTPNLDALAKEGVTFTRCYSNHPLCSPYRASLLTGRFQQQTGVGRNVMAGDAALPVTEITIADELKKAGYATGYIGKWHLYPGVQDGVLVPAGPHRHGFDWWRATYNFRDRYHAWHFDDDGKKVAMNDYAPKCEMDLAIEFVEKHREGPFCLFLSWQPPHPPYKDAPEKFRAPYAGGVDLRANVPNASDTRRLRRDHLEYFANISALDDEVGRMMKKLAELGLADNTLLCYSSDHGDMLGSFGLANKNKPWDESINVPFIVRWPAGIAGGRRLDAIFSTVDIAPTLLGLAGAEGLAKAQGLDLSPALRGNKGPEPESAFIMGSMNDGEDLGLRGPPAKGEVRQRPDMWRGIRTSRCTYCRHGGRLGAAEPWLLYDNEKDPLQTHNLIDDAASADLRKQLDARLSQWLRKVGEA